MVLIGFEILLRNCFSGWSMIGSFVLEFLGPLCVFVSVLVETIHNLKVPFAHFSHSQVTYSALRIMLQAFYFLV